MYVTIHQYVFLQLSPVAQENDSDKSNADGTPRFLRKEDADEIQRLFEKMSSDIDSEKLKEINQSANQKSEKLSENQHPK